MNVDYSFAVATLTVVATLLVLLVVQIALDVVAWLNRQGGGEQSPPGEDELPCEHGYYDLDDCPVCGH